MGQLLNKTEFLTFFLLFLLYYFYFYLDYQNFELKTIILANIDIENQSFDIFLQILTLKTKQWTNFVIENQFF